MTLRHFLADDDLSHSEQHHVLDLADAFKADPFGHAPFAGAPFASLSREQSER